MTICLPELLLFLLCAVSSITPSEKEQYSKLSREYAAAHSELKPPNFSLVTYIFIVYENRLVAAKKLFQVYKKNMDESRILPLENIKLEGGQDIATAYEKLEKCIDIYQNISVKYNSNIIRYILETGEGKVQYNDQEVELRIPGKEGMEIVYSYSRSNIKEWVMQDIIENKLIECMVQYEIYDDKTVAGMLNEKPDKKVVFNDEEMLSVVYKNIISKEPRLKESWPQYQDVYGDK